MEGVKRRVLTCSSATTGVFVVGGGGGRGVTEIK